ncbi:MAG: four helix bundle protein [Blastocatellia bacterium]
MDKGESATVASPRAPARSFRDLVVWQKAHEFVLATYKLTDNFPRTEVYGLTSRLRRAAVSIPANIAEGFRRRTKNEKARFLNIAQGSLEECRYYLILAEDLGYGDCRTTSGYLDEVSRLLEKYCSVILASRAQTWLRPLILYSDS